MDSNSNKKTIWKYIKRTAQRITTKQTTSVTSSSSLDRNNVIHASQSNALYQQQCFEENITDVNDANDFEIVYKSRHKIKMVEKRSKSSHDVQSADAQVVKSGKHRRRKSGVTTLHYRNDSLGRLEQFRTADTNAQTTLDNSVSNPLRKVSTFLVRIHRVSKGAQELRHQVPVFNHHERLGHDSSTSVVVPTSRRYCIEEA